MLVRLILIAAAIWFGVKLWRKFQQSSGEVRGPRAPERFEPMVRCRQCGVHLPRSAASANGLCGKCSG